MTTLLEKSSHCTRAAILAMTLAAVLSGCSSNAKKTQAETQTYTEAELYQQAANSMDSQLYTEAVATLRKLESQYPFGSFAQQAQLDIIYAYYNNSEPEAARAAADRFIRLHPNHPDVDYAYYMKGLASNTATMGLLDRFLPIDETSRDPGAARQSFNDFAQLMARFPQSKYVPDARQRMVALRNRLADYELHAANYYMKRKAYVAAINRARYVVENMQETPAVAEALAIIIEGNQHLGLKEPAQNALAVLKKNYPDHPALNKNGDFVGYKMYDDVDPSFLSTITFGLLGESSPEAVKAPEPPKSEE